MFSVVVNGVVYNFYFFKVFSAFVCIWFFFVHFLFCGISRISLCFYLNFYTFWSNFFVFFALILFSSPLDFCLSLICLQLYISQNCICGNLLVIVFVTQIYFWHCCIFLHFFYYGMIFFSRLSYWIFIILEKAFCRRVRFLVI